MFSYNEKIAYKKGYTITKDGVVVSPYGKTVGTHGREGYLYFAIERKGTHDKKVFIHRFQAYIKFGNKIYKHSIVVRHLNGNKLDNSWDNIMIGTNKENAQDVPKEQRMRIALNANKYSVKARKVLTDEQELELCRLKKDGYTYRQLKEKYGLKAYSTIQHIIHRGVEQLVSSLL